ncbi:MAG: PAS domain S-box protein [Bacteroidales bacterium]|nr:PAS domain S-box protein [Bacteroidales bacterium]
MVSIDIRTIILSFTFTGLVSTLVVFMLWMQYRKRYMGTIYLVLNFAMLTVSLLLVSLRGQIPDWISIIAANTFLIAGFILGHRGLENFTGKRSFQWHNIAVLILFTAFQIWFTIANPALEARNLSISVAGLLITSQTAWLMLRRVPAKSRNLTLTAGIVYILFSLVCAINIIYFITGEKEMPVDFFNAAPFDSFSIIMVNMLIIMLTYSLVLMYSKRLHQDVQAEEKKYDNVTREERNLLRTLIDNLADPVSLTDNEGRFLLNNRAHLSFIGVESQSETTGKTLGDFLPEEEAVKTAIEDQKVLQTGRLSLDMIESGTHYDTGFTYWHQTSRIPIPNSNGGPSRLITIRHDITERKRAEDFSRSNAEFNNVLLKTIPFGMDIIDEEGTVLFLSENYRRIFGQEAVGKKCWDLYRDDKLQCAGCPLLSGIREGKTEILEADGLMGGKTFNIYHTGMMYQGKKAMLEIFHDITIHKQVKDDLIMSKERAEESDRLKTAFLQNISHEIRTPMNGIVGFTSLLREPDLDSESFKAYLELITQSSDQLLAIVTDIIEIANIEAGKMNVNKTKTNINTVITNLYKQFQPVADLRGLELRHSVPATDEEPIYIVDNVRLTQILTNLIGNALKFTDKGSVTFGYFIKQGSLEFHVTDTGIGIDKDQQQKIFERFYQVDSGKTREHEGTGLGLSLSKGYIEFMGGNIWVTSEPGKGSTFFVSLPAETEESIQKV